MRILVVEDEAKMAALLRRGLTDHGLAADVAGRGEDALWMAAAIEYDAIVLDVMLPGIDGFATCRRLRDAEVWAPVLMLTARDALADRVAGLDGGADDYLVKPFAFDELLARLRALVRRGPAERPAVLTAGDLRLDPAARRVRRGDAEIALSAREFAMLEAFMRRPGRVLSRFQLLEAVWDDDYENRSNVVDVYVRYLRDKVDRPFGVTSIETVRGVGYALRADGGCSPAIPLRLRLTLAFAGVMAVVLVVAGIAIRAALASALDESIDAGLWTRAAEVGALVGTADGGLARAGASGLTEAGESFAQVLAADGRVLEATPPLRDRPLLGGTELARALPRRRS